MPVQKKFSVAFGSMVTVSAVIIFTDMQILYPEIIIFKKTISIIQICFALSYSFDLGTGKHNAGLP
jgi:hypothetical protein